MMRVYILLAGTLNNVAVIMILFYRSCLFNLCSVTTSTQNPSNWQDWQVYEAKEQIM